MTSISAAEKKYTPGEFGAMMAVGGTVGAAVAAFVVLIGVAMLALDAWIISTLWRWLVTPKFAAAPSLSWAQAAGFVLIYRVLTFRWPTKKDDRENQPGWFWVFGFVMRVGLPLACGWALTWVL